MDAKKRMIQVGCGGFGAYWLEVIMPRVASFAEVVAAVDVNEEALKNAQKFVGLAPEKCYTDIKKALEENEADFVNVVVPPQFHESVINAAFEAGLDVISEKPLGGSMEACVRICRKAEASGRKLAVTMSHRFEVEKQTMEDMVKSGRYGKANYIVSRLNMKRMMNRNTESTVESYVNNALIHNLDTIRGICGCNVKSVYANCWISKLDVSSAASGLVILEMEDGTRAVLEESFANGSDMDGWSDEYLRAECDYATIVADHRKVTVKSDMGYPYPKREEVPLMENEYWDHALIIHDFVRWLNGGEHPVTWYNENLQCCALTYATIESAVTGKVVDVQEFLKRYEEALV